MSFFIEINVEHEALEPQEDSFVIEGEVIELEDEVAQEIIACAIRSATTPSHLIHVAIKEIAYFKKTLDHLENGQEILTI